MNLLENTDKRKKPQYVEIRQMEIDDLPRVFHLGERLFRAEKVPNLYRTWDEFEVVELFRGDSEFCLVAELDDKVIGFALGSKITKSHSAWKYGHLIWLGVDPACQRRGTAERLFNRFRDLMLKEGVRMLIVDTEAENLSSLHFFRKMGFGNPQQHIYLTLNLAARKQLLKKKREESSFHSRLPKNHE
jgi:ribosomal protein S18 acetylase RimI-like enzyme